MSGLPVRDELIDQVAYLVDELHAQEAILSLVPKPLWSAVLPTGEHSLLELYGLLAALSERVYPRILDAWSPGGVAAVTTIDEEELRDSEAWNDASPVDLVGRIVAAREAVVQRFRALGDDAWTETREVDGRSATPVDIAYRITQEDVLILRSIAERLHDANLGGSPVTTP